MAKRKPEQLVTISCRAPERVRRQLDRLAEASRQSTSSYMRWLIEDVITKDTNSAAKQGVAVHE